MNRDPLKVVSDGCKKFWSEVLSGTVTPIRSAAAVRPEVSTEPLEDTASAADSQIEQTSQDIDDICASCDDKWLVITITRHTKHEFGGQWDCTVGDLKMEIWDAEDSGSGPLIFECGTSERGGPASPNFYYQDNKTQGINYAYYNQYMIVARDSYGLSPHDTVNYKTYGYNRKYLNKPRPGIAVYGSGSGAMDRRDGVLIHAGSNHRWSVGCIVLHRDGAVSGGRFRFNQSVSVNTLLEFLEKIHQFSGASSLPVRQKIPRIKLIIKEAFK